MKKSKKRPVASDQEDMDQPFQSPAEIENRGQEPAPERDSIQQYLDEGPGPLRNAGELRGDQLALRNETQHGGVERPTAHRGRDSFRRDKSRHR